MGNVSGIAPASSGLFGEIEVSKTGSARREPDGFAQFWAAYPRKVGKLAAEKAYRQAVKQASAGELLEGVQRYLRTKPSYADWCHPKTWLNQGRWMDEASASGSQMTPGTTSRTEWVCQHEPHCPHWTACAVVSMRGRGR